MSPSGRRSGFTLPEILVTVTVIAVLAAAVVPAVTQYVNKGNAPASQQDIQQLQNAVTGFTADVRHYPGDLQQLVTPIVATSGSGDSLNLDGAASPVQFTAVEAARWRGPYTSAAITTSSTGGGQFTSNGLLFTVGRKITLSGGWLTVPILNPTTCAAILALNHSLDNTGPSANNEGTDGIVVWTGTCAGNSMTGSVTNPLLRIAPAN
ncbi:MAG TPA: prepilin-type N-terminal cleavage/methylation domain-containing protein [Gemmatimonadaceae bacterium]